MLLKSDQVFLSAFNERAYPLSGLVDSTQSNSVLVFEAQKELVKSASGRHCSHIKLLCPLG